MNKIDKENSRYIGRGIGFNGLPTSEDVAELRSHLEDLRYILCISEEEFRNIDPFFRLDWDADKKNKLIGLYKEKIKMIRDEIKTIERIKPYRKPDFSGILKEA